MASTFVKPENPISTDLEDREFTDSDEEQPILDPKNIDDLPNEIITKLFHYIPPGHLFTRISLVCHKWRQLALTYLKSKPVTLVLCESERYVQDEYVFRDTTNRFAFFDVPLRCYGSCRTVYCNIHPEPNKPPCHLLNNVTQLVFSCSESHFCSEFMLQLFAELIVQYRTSLTHFKLLTYGPKAQWHKNWNWKTTVWQVIADTNLPLLQHLSIFSAQNFAPIKAAADLLPQLDQFYFGADTHHKIDLFKLLSGLNEQKCTSIGIYLTAPRSIPDDNDNEDEDENVMRDVIIREEDFVKRDLKKLKKDRPAIWRKINRVFVSRGVYREAIIAQFDRKEINRTILDYVNPDSVTYLQLARETPNDYKAHRDDVCRLPRLTHLWISFSPDYYTHTYSPPPETMFDFSGRDESAGKSRSIRTVQIYSTAHRLSHSFENVLDRVKLHFPNIDRVDHIRRTKVWIRNILEPMIRDGEFIVQKKDWRGGDAFY